MVVIKGRSTYVEGWDEETPAADNWQGSKLEAYGTVGKKTPELEGVQIRHRLGTKHNSNTTLTNKIAVDATHNSHISIKRRSL